MSAISDSSAQDQRLRRITERAEHVASQVEVAQRQNQERLLRTLLGWRYSPVKVVRGRVTHTIGPIGLAKPTRNSFARNLSGRIIDFGVYPAEHHPFKGMFMVVEVDCGQILSGLTWASIKCGEQLVLELAYAELQAIGQPKPLDPSVLVSVKGSSNLLRQSVGLCNMSDISTGVGWGDRLIQLSTVRAVRNRYVVVCLHPDCPFLDDRPETWEEAQNKAKLHAFRHGTIG